MADREVVQVTRVSHPRDMCISLLRWVDNQTQRILTVSGIHDLLAEESMWRGQWLPRVLEGDLDLVDGHGSVLESYGECVVFPSGDVVEHDIFVGLKG